MSSITLKVGESVTINGVTITAVSCGTLNESGVQSKTMTIDVVDSSDVVDSGQTPAAE